jgi:LysR substrate binding domain
VDGVICEELLREPAVLAINRDHPLAGLDRVALADLSDECFALVDERGGPGYNQAVMQLCRAAGLEPTEYAGARVGPMAWEMAVRRGCCVGLTTRSAAQSSARGVTLLELEPTCDFALQLVLPAGAALQRPATASLVRLAREMAAHGELFEETVAAG